jgi:hypothetical protein
LKPAKASFVDSLNSKLQGGEAVISDRPVFDTLPAGLQTLNYVGQVLMTINLLPYSCSTETFSQRFDVGVRKLFFEMMDEVLESAGQYRRVARRGELPPSIAVRSVLEPEVVPSDFSIGQPEHRPDPLKANSGLVHGPVLVSALPLQVVERSVNLSLRYALDRVGHRFAIFNSICHRLLGLFDFKAPILQQIEHQVKTSPAVIGLYRLPAAPSLPGEA